MIVLHPRSANSVLNCTRSGRLLPFLYDRVLSAVFMGALQRWYASIWIKILCKVSTSRCVFISAKFILWMNGVALFLLLKQPRSRTHSGKVGSSKITSLPLVFVTVLRVQEDWNANFTRVASWWGRYIYLWSSSCTANGGKTIHLFRWEITMYRPCLLVVLHRRSCKTWFHQARKGTETRTKTLQWNEIIRPDSHMKEKFQSRAQSHASKEKAKLILRRRSHFRSQFPWCWGITGIKKQAIFLYCQLPSKTSVGQNASRCRRVNLISK